MDHNKLWKILKKMGIPDHLTCLLRNLYSGQEATVRTGHGTTDWFQIGKGVCQGYILSPCSFNLYAEYIMRNTRLDEAQGGIKIARRNISNLRFWCWEGLGAEGEGDNRGWDGWMASPTWWTWVWVNSGRWWWTVACCHSWGGTELDTTEWLNWIIWQIN